MPARLLLILDLAPERCRGDACRRVDTVLEACLSPDMDVQATSRLPAAGAPAPDVVVVRCAAVPQARDALRRVRQRWGAVPLVGCFCGGGTDDPERMRPLLEELDDFLFCPFGECDLTLRVRRLLRRGADERRAADPMLGESGAFVRVLDAIPLLAGADATVLITGETGTGKEVAARAIHYRSPRRGHPFIPVNCGAVPDHLFENEMFGHVRGAFTDAGSSEKGLVAEAESGSLFLDEVDALSLAAQVKLLRLLQGGEYRPLGSARAQVADVRVITATNADLREKVRTGGFREDLFYRLNVLRLPLPPLRDRVDDIPLLADHFLTRFGSRYGRDTVRLSAEATRKLLAYSWPGNVRELEGVLQRAVILSRAPVLDPGDLDLPAAPGADGGAACSFQDAKARAIEQFERAYLVELLNEHDGNVTRAALGAGKERRAFQRLLRKHGLDGASFRS